MAADTTAGTGTETLVQDERTLTLEAFADTVLPGEKRSPDDRAVAGIAPGGGAVAAGALALLERPEGGMAEGLDGLAALLNTHAAAYRESHDLLPDRSGPAFVTLPARDRVALVEDLVRPGHPEKAIWTGLVMFCFMAFDTGAFKPTRQALAEGHVGLRTIGFYPPEEDGQWRFPESSYRRATAELHPDTDDTGSLR